MSIENQYLVEHLKTFIFSHYPRARSSDLTNDDSLFDSGVVDSLGILDLVNFIEDKFSVTVLEEDLNPENFYSITSIACYLSQRASIPDQPLGKDHLREAK